MALGFSSYDRLERKLLRTRNKLGEGATDTTFREENKTQALQLAASLYDLYDGDGSETTYTDSSTLTIIESEMIATSAALELLTSAISYYKDDVTSATAGPSSASFRTDKLAWLQAQIDKLENDLETLEEAAGYGTDDALPALLLKKVRACCDPVDDVCPEDDCADGESFEVTI